MQNSWLKLRLPVFIGSLCALIATGCGPENPPAEPDVIESVCCETEDGTEYTSNVACNEVSGTEVPIVQCESICCHQPSGLYDWLSPADCMGNGGLSSFPTHCADVCCDIEGQTPSVMLQGNCAFQGGTEVADEVCEPVVEEVCCKTEAGIAMVVVDDCLPENVLEEELCDRSYCCKIMDGPDAGNALQLSWPDCIEAGGSVVYDGYCDQRVCCETESGPQLVPYVDCTFLQLTDNADCDPVLEEACCKIMDGPGAGNAVMATPSDCAEQGGAYVPEEYCSQVLCCNTDDGPQLLPYEECTFLQLLATSDCEPREEQCCKIMIGPGLGNAFMATPEDCVSQNGAVMDAEFCSQELCCDTGDGPQIMPYMECTFLQLLATDECTPPEEEQCCKISFGVDTGNVLMATPADCAEEGGIITVQEYCDQQFCCETDDGYQMLPFLECPFWSINWTGACDETKVCCKTETGLGWVADGDCEPENVQNSDLCERPYCCKIMTGPNAGNALTIPWPDCVSQGGSIVYDGYCEQVICCETDSGPQLVPFDQCTFLQLTETANCDPVHEEACCKIMDGPGAGNAILATPSDCAEQGGAYVPEDYCSQVLCCNTDDGPQLIPYQECTFLQLLATSDCEPPQEEQCCKTMIGPGLGNAFMATPEDCVSQNGAVMDPEYCTQELCCDTGDGPQIMPYMDCTFLQLLATDECTPPEEEQCCKISFGVGTGNVIMATPSDCAEEGGIITVQDYCDQEFCCETEDGFEMLPFLECPFLSINWTGACEETMVCCATSSLPEMVPESECEPTLVLPEPDCHPKICCSTGDGNFFEGTDQECEANGGTPIDPLFCDPAEDPMVCCVTNDDEAYIPQSECVELAGNVTPAACVVCCEYPGGGVGMDPTEFCLAGQGAIVPDEVCNPPEMVCCQIGEEASYILDTACTEQGGATTDIQECQVCCKNPFGNGPEFVFEEECLANGSEVNPDFVCEPADEP